MGIFVNRYLPNIFCKTFFATIFFVAASVGAEVLCMSVTDAQHQKVNAATEKVFEKLPEIDKACEKASEAIDKMPPEAFMSRLERFKNKPLVKVSGTITRVNVPVTPDSTDEHIIVADEGDPSVIRSIPLTASLSFSGKNLLQAGFLGTAYGIDYLKYKDLNKFDEDLLLRKMVEHKDQLIKLLQDLKYTGKKGYFSKLKSGFSSVAKIFDGSFINSLKSDNKKKETPPDEDKALDTLKSFLKKECIKSALLKFRDHLPGALGYMVAQEGMCMAHDKAFDESASTSSNFIKTLKAAESIDATIGFWTKNVYQIKRCYNNKTNKIDVPVELLAAPFFGASYALYFNNTYASNKNSVTKWLLKWAYPKTSLDWLNSRWFYLMKKSAMHARFIQQSNGHYEQQVLDYCMMHSKELLNILTEKIENLVPSKAEKPTSPEPVKSQRELLRTFIHDASTESFYAWRNFKYTSLNRTSMFFELATLLPAVPKIYSALRKLWEFVRTDY